MVFLGVEPRIVRVVLDEGLCELGVTSAEGLRDGEAGRAPFLIMPWHSPYNWEKARKTSVRAGSLRPKLVQIIFKDSVRTAKKTPHFTVTKINRLTLFKEIIAVYCQNDATHINTKRNLLISKAGGTNIYQATAGLQRVGE
jgi:hypothetical protein